MYNINDLDALQSVMSSNDAVLTYVGAFNQDTVKSMLKYTESKLESSGVKDLTRKKIFNVMTEMLQNISKHQNDTLNNENEAAVFILGEKEDGFYLLTGNNIGNNLIELVEGKINIINGLNKEELKEYYKKMRLNSTISDVGGAGLGFIDIVRKSENKLEFKFIPQGNMDSFFILKATISND